MARTRKKPKVVERDRILLANRPIVLRDGQALTK